MSARRPVKVGVGELIVAALTLAGGLAMSVVLGGSLVLVLVMGAVLVLGTPVAFYLRWNWARAGFIAVLYFVVLVSATSVGGYSKGYALAWFVSSGVGLVLLGGLFFRQWWSRRLASAEGAAPSGLDPRGQKDVGVLAWWKDGVYEYEMVDPTPEVVLAAVQEVDGRERSIVSVYRGRGRLDVAGDVRAEMLVQQSDDRRKWHQVTSTVEAPGRAPKVWVNVAGFAVKYPADRLTDLHGAQVAMSTWLANGQRDGTLGWWDDSSFDMVERPKYLKDTD